MAIDELDNVPYASAQLLEEWQLPPVLQRQVKGMSSAMHPHDVRVPAMKYLSSRSAFPGNTFIAIAQAT